jgi:hypothetical protein
LVVWAGKAAFSEQWVKIGLEACKINQDIQVCNLPLSVIINTYILILGWFNE